MIEHELIAFWEADRLNTWKPTIISFSRALGREIREDKPPADVSMAPAVCLSQLFVVLAVAPFASPGTVTEGDLALLVLLGVGQMGLGLVFLTIGARLIPAAEVALITLLEVVLGPLWVWLALSEEPASTTIVGGLVVVVAVLLQTTKDTQTRSTPHY